MRIPYLLLSLLLIDLLPGLVHAHDCFLPINKISIPLHAEQWVTTKSALVTVVVNAAVTADNIEKVQNDVMKKLNQFADKSEWHVISVERQLDRSGLENIQITAQARLALSDLSSLNVKAKKLSQAGETFTVDSMQFVPSEDEIRQANSDLRVNIYQQAKLELDAVNKLYTSQQYYIHEVNFTNATSPPVAPMYMAKMATDGSSNRMTAPMSVNNKQEMQAVVILASPMDSSAQKLTHS